MKVLGISGSLRQGSYNTALLRAALELAPPGMQIEPFEIGNFPLYNEDLRVAGLPPAVQAFRQAIQAADALLFATPEYNYSVPGVLKNAIDWASRPPNDQPLAGKPVAIMGASTGNFGTVRAQMHLRQMCVFLDMHPLNKPEVLVFRAAEKFDAQGHLVDATARDLVRGLLLALQDWTQRLRASG
ncbi:NADPH-dependent FMN reductase [Meiothermus granaticius]|uniref:NAD(P)H-dependent FMN reductase n=1 Tax=Meiothermus granaticius NBRC 107808 TaxID=1227551 RepID=A0A399FA14_9DEIN|nr:NADPH-dependent FMN reductase [Meiothermus granaticius]RIH91752.1 NAD(P)H-dependent FMN reductase [Meiothermus granaticius NBRC 107808]GEM88124.1 NAD(P)H-dependent FMN reductase [Meiothermus granaticius NBRC 107808]